MNNNQRKALIGTATLIALMTLYPPVLTHSYSTGTLRGYDWIFIDPTATVNITVLLIQIFVTLLVGGILYLVLDKRNNK